MKQLTSPAKPLSQLLYLFSFHCGVFQFHCGVFYTFYSLWPKVYWVHIHQHGKNYYTAVNVALWSHLWQTFLESELSGTLLWSYPPVSQCVSAAVSAPPSHTCTCRSFTTSGPETTESWVFWRVRCYRWDGKHGTVTFFPRNTSIILKLPNTVQRLLLVVHKSHRNVIVNIGNWIFWMTGAVYWMCLETDLPWKPSCYIRKV